MLSPSNLPKDALSLVFVHWYFPFEKGVLTHLNKLDSYRSRIFCTNEGEIENLKFTDRRLTADHARKTHLNFKLR